MNILLKQDNFPFNYSLLNFYKNHLLNSLIPFWQKMIDKNNGGIYTCINNEGTELLNKDKYTWSQGRFVFIWSRIAWMIREGILEGEETIYLEQAKKTIDFLLKNVFMDNGNCAYLLTETGTPKDIMPGKGFDLSIYADCFVVLGLAEYARVTSDIKILEKALIVYDSILQRIKKGRFRSEPYPIPKGIKAHSIPMILLNISQVLFTALDISKHKRADEVKQYAFNFASEIMTDFYSEEDGRITEMLAPQGSKISRTILCRHVNPGHIIEDMWFVMHTVRDCDGKKEWIEQAAKAIKYAFEIGWDTQYGGLFRFVDCEGGKPKGAINGDAYEKLIIDTWDMKLWWPHSELLYATLLAFNLTGDEYFLTAYKKSHDYVFNTFPNTDKNVGEWIQIRDRQGKPMEKIVALPVKDPFHIIRDVILIIELIYNTTICKKGLK